MLLHVIIYTHHHSNHIIAAYERIIDLGRSVFCGGPRLPGPCPGVLRCY